MRDHCESSERPLDDLQEFPNVPKGLYDSLWIGSYSWPPEAFSLGLGVRWPRERVGNAFWTSVSRFGR